MPPDAWTSAGARIPGGLPVSTSAAIANVCGGAGVLALWLGAAGGIGPDGPMAPICELASRAGLCPRDRRPRSSETRGPDSRPRHRGPDLGPTGYLGFFSQVPSTGRSRARAAGGAGSLVPPCQRQWRHQSTCPLVGCRRSVRPDGPWLRSIRDAPLTRRRTRPPGSTAPIYEIRGPSSSPERHGPDRA